MDESMGRKKKNEGVRGGGTGGGRWKKLRAEGTFPLCPRCEKPLEPVSGGCACPEWNDGEEWSFTALFFGLTAVVALVLVNQYVLAPQRAADKAIEAVKTAEAPLLRKINAQFESSPSLSMEGWSARTVGDKWALVYLLYRDTKDTRSKRKAYMWVVHLDGLERGRRPRECIERLNGIKDFVDRYIVPEVDKGTFFGPYAYVARKVDGAAVGGK